MKKEGIFCENGSLIPHQMTVEACSLNLDCAIARIEPASSTIEPAAAFIGLVCFEITITSPLAGLLFAG